AEIKKPKATKTVNADPKLIRFNEHPTLGPMYACYAKDKSYICSKVPGSSKRTLFLEIRKPQTEDHAALISRLMRLACQHKFSKEQAKTWRAKQLK
ncbi:unnamed protein product, partial [Prorocentrum cordatum]